MNVFRTKRCYRPIKNIDIVVNGLFPPANYTQFLSIANGGDEINGWFKLDFNCAKRISSSVSELIEKEISAIDRQCVDEIKDALIDSGGNSNSELLDIVSPEIVAVKSIRGKKSFYDEDGFVRVDDLVGTRNVDYFNEILSGFCHGMIDNANYAFAATNSMDIYTIDSNGHIFLDVFCLYEAGKSTDVYRHKISNCLHNFINGIVHR